MTFHRSKQLVALLAATTLFTAEAAKRKKPVDPCVAALGQAAQTMPPKITRGEVEAFATEYPSGGTRLAGNRALASVKDGEYIYLIARVPGQVEPVTLWSEKFPPPKQEGDPYEFVSHRSLEGMLRTISAEFEILASGETRVFNGETIKVDNRSRTYPGNRNHLDYAKQVLTSHGLPVHAKTKYVDWAEAATSKGHPDLDRKHAEDERMGMITRVMEKDPILSQTVKDWDRFYRNLARKYPHPEFAGLAMWVPFASLKAAGAREKSRLISTLSFMMNDGSHLAVWVVYRSNGNDPEATRDIFQEMQDDLTLAMAVHQRLNSTP